MVGFEIESTQCEDGVEEAHVVLDPGPARQLHGLVRSFTGTMELPELEEGTAANPQQDSAGSGIGVIERAVTGRDGGGRILAIEVGSRR